MEAVQNKVNSDVLFAQKIYLCAQLLGAKSDLLSTIGSWRQELNDEQVFISLDAWIEERVNEQKQSLEYVSKWHKR